MSDRPKALGLRMRRVVESSKLDENARDIAAVLGAEFRHRVVQAQLAAEEAAFLARKAAGAGAASASWTAAQSLVPAMRRARSSASRTATHTVVPAVRRARSSASRTATSTVAPAVASAAANAGHRAAPALRHVSDQADDALREFAASEAGRATVVGAIAGAAASVAMGAVMVAAHRVGAMSEVPPKEITTKGAKKAAKEAEKAARKKAKREQAEARRHGDERSAEASDAGHSDAEASKEDRAESAVDTTKARAGEAVEAGARAIHHTPSAAFNVAATALHVGFGMVLGAGFGLVHSQLPREWRDPLPTLGESVAFATAVWAGSYAGWVPLLGLMPAPHEDEPGRPATMIASHWIFGAILGAGLVAGLRATED